MLLSVDSERFDSKGSQSLISRSSSTGATNHARPCSGVLENAREIVIRSLEEATVRGRALEQLIMDVAPT